MLINHKIKIEKEFCLYNSIIFSSSIIIRMTLIFTKEENHYYTFVFANGFIIRLNELPNCDRNGGGKYIEYLKDVIGGKINASYSIQCDRDTYYLVMKNIKNKQIIFSLWNEYEYDAMEVNPHNNYFKPLVEITMDHKDCTDALVNLYDTVVSHQETFE